MSSGDVALTVTADVHTDTSTRSGQSPMTETLFDSTKQYLIMITEV